MLVLESRQGVTGFFKEADWFFDGIVPAHRTQNLLGIEIVSGHAVHLVLLDISG